LRLKLPRIRTQRFKGELSEVASLGWSFYQEG
jgi:hypothetical protein